MFYLYILAEYIDNIGSKTRFYYPELENDFPNFTKHFSLTWKSVDSNLNVYQYAFYYIV